MLYAQLVCKQCHRISNYPYDALSTSCRNCGEVNAAQNMLITCPTCSQQMLAAVNALRVLCPCCTTVVEIPLEMLPRVPAINSSPMADQHRSIFVSFPTLESGGQIGASTSANSFRYLTREEREELASKQKLKESGEVDDAADQDSDTKMLRVVRGTPAHEPRKSAPVTVLVATRIL